MCVCVCVYVCVCVCRSPRSSGGWSLTGTGVRLSVYLARERGREGGREGGREIGRSGVGVGEERERRKSCRVPSRVRVHRPPMCAKKRERERDVCASPYVCVCINRLDSRRESSHYQPRDVCVSPHFALSKSRAIITLICIVCVCVSHYIIWTYIISSLPLLVSPLIRKWCDLHIRISTHMIHAELFRP